MQNQLHTARISRAHTASLATAAAVLLGLSACESATMSGADGAVANSAPAQSPAARSAAPSTLKGPAPTDSMSLMSLGYVDHLAPARELERSLELAEAIDFEEDASGGFGQLSFEQLLAAIRPVEGESPEAYYQRQMMTRPFVPTTVDAISTFGLETDTASYTMARAQLEAGALPQPWNVRVEEFVHAIDSDIPAPQRGDFSVSTDLVPSPFGSDEAWICRIGLRARDVADFERGPLALTFVVDRSGSMNSPERMPMVKRVLGLLAEQLDARDQIAVVTYSSDAEVLVPPSAGSMLYAAMDDIQSIRPGGSTNIDAGLGLACDVAAENYLEGAQNFVVLLSDGLGNVGEVEADALLAKTEEARERGLFLNTVGVGMYARDRFLERLANAGDGRCDYVDREEEARRAFVDRFTGAFQVVAKDAKLQVEFDPAQVGRWRLIGFENRAIADADFTNDAVDAGEIGAGHSVAALYELEDVRFEGGRPLGEVRLRYFPEERSEAVEAQWGIELSGLHPDFDAAPSSLRAQVCMAQFGELVAKNAHASTDSPNQLVATARRVSASFPDEDFAGAVELMAAAELLLNERSLANRREPVMEIGRQLAFAHYQHLLEARRDPASAETAAAADVVSTMEAAFHAEVDSATDGAIDLRQGAVEERAG